MIALCVLVAVGGAAEPLPPGATWAHDSAWVGVAWEARSEGPGVGMPDLAAAPFAISLAARHVAAGPIGYGAGLNERIRLSRDETGRVVVDHLSLQARVAAIEVRPALGDRLDVSLLGGRWDQDVFALARPWTQLQLFVPLRLVALGFSDTDADADTLLRYYAAAGGGFGADWLVRLAGPIALRLRAEAAAETLHRLRREDRDQVRHTVWTRGEADVLVTGRLGTSVGVWGEHHTAWEPRDDPEGVDRQVLAGGIHFGVRLAGRPPSNPDPGRSGRTRGHQRHNAENDALRETVEHPEPDPSAPPPPPTLQEHDAANDANDAAIEALRGEEPE